MLECVKQQRQPDLTMPSITAVKQQQKRNDRYSIFIDGRYAFSLSEQQVIDLHVTQGREVDEQDLHKLLHQSDFGKALDKCYNFLSFRPRSVREIKQYLARKGYDEDMAQEIIHRLVEQSYLNDAQFAEQWVRERREFGLKSRQQLMAELRQKGIDSEIIDMVLNSELEASDIHTIAQLIVANSLQRRYPEEQKLIQYLQRKGFRYGDIKAALEQLLES